MLEIKITFDEINYDSVIDFLWPVISAKLEQQLTAGGGAKQFLSKLLNRSQSFNATVAKKLIAALPEDKREEIIASCLDNADESIKTFFEKEMQKSGVQLNIRDFDVHSR